MKKLLISTILAGSLITSASAWDFCSDESQIAIDVSAMGIGTAIASGVSGGVPGLIVGAIANQLLCTPQAEATVDSTEVKTLVDNELNTTDVLDAKTVYFDYDVYTLNAAGKDSANITAEAIKTSTKLVNKPIRIEGNADARGSDEYNYALGLKRANAVKAALINTGVTNSLEVVSYGEAKPECSEVTEDCFAKNRRVQFKQAQ